MIEAPDPSVCYEPIAVSVESTVVAEFVPEALTASGYQSEADLEAAFIKQLEGQAYERLSINSNDAARCEPADAT